MPVCSWRLPVLVGPVLVGLALGLVGSGSACGAGTSPPQPQERGQEAPGPQVPGQQIETDASVPAAAIAPVAVAFPSSEATSQYPVGDASSALDRFRRQEFSLADEAIGRALSAERVEAELRFALVVLRARVARARGDWEGAAKSFAEATETPSNVADYLHYEAARAYAKAGSPKAQGHAAKVGATSPWGPQMEFLLAESARAGDRLKEATERYQNFLGSNTGSSTASEARYRLGEVLAARGLDEDARREWRALLVADPTSTWAASKRKDDKKLEAKLSAEEFHTRGMAYFRANRNLESEKDLAAALATGELSASDRCLALFHRAKSVFKERDYKRAAPKFLPAIRACKASGNTDYEVKSAYQVGLTYGRLRDYKNAAKHFLYIEQYPEHSYADDARLRQAEQFASLKDDAKVTSLLSTIPERYPRGDMRAEAMWRLARRAYVRDNFEGATKWLREQIRLVPIERNWWAEGQAHYWLGRSLAKQEKLADAAEAYRECIRRYPLTYYSLQAFARLKESWPEEYTAMGTEVAAQKSPWSGELMPRARYATPEFRSALALARLGIGDATRKQLAAIGMNVPAGRAAADNADSIDSLVATSTLLDLAGDYEHSHWIGRWHAVDYRRHWPTGANRSRWQLAYPRAFWGLLQEFAGTYSYPSQLQMAIVREESAFDPSRESWANAIGLTQMIFATAIDHSKESGIKVTRENLQHPVKNVTIGSHFLESLQVAFDGRVGLMVPGYNAGRARVRGWIRQRNRYDLDEFIELIPGDQARRYTKRVLGSYFTYSYLGTGVVPDIRNAVPRKLGKKR